MTTNGLTLTRQASALRDAGLTRVNISLDSLDREKFRRITGVDGLTQVLNGIDSAIFAGLKPVKLNCVVVRGENDHELPDLLVLAAQKGVEIRFIELMPMGPLAGQWSDRFVPQSEMRQRLNPVVTLWLPRPGNSGDSARRFRVGLAYGRSARVGFITAMSCPFCAGCNRIRIASDGTYYPCLMDRPAGSIMPALRPSFDEERLEHILFCGLRDKAPVHPAAGVAVMTQIGG
jgi:cyclic pyranopterin phosphate synthase